MSTHLTAAINRAFEHFIRGGFSRLAVSLLVPFVMLTIPGFAQVVKDLHSFNGNDSSQDPQLVTLAQGRDGKLYGTTGG